MKRTAGLGMLLALLWTAGLPLVASAAAGAQEPAPPALQQAIDSYRSAQQTADRAARVAAFRRAQHLFEAAARQARPTADLQANIGTAALQAENLGAAVLALRRAQALEPSHVRARTNLEQARSLLDPAIPRPRDVPGSGLPEQLSRLPALAPAAAWALAGLLGGLALWRRSRALGVAAATLLLVAGALRILPELVAAGPGAADAVLMTEARAYAADSLHAPLRYAQPLPPGTEVEIVERRGQWLRIRLADATEAWITAGHVERVQPVQAGH